MGPEGPRMETLWQKTHRFLSLSYHNDSSRGRRIILDVGEYILGPFSGSENHSRGRE